MILTLKELADYLRVNERTILRMLKNGQVRGSKIGGQWRFNGSEVDKIFFPDGPPPEVDAVSLADLTGSTRIKSPLDRMIRADRFIADMQATSVEEVIQELTVPLARANATLDFAGLRRRLLEREQLLSTAVGQGVAIPHPRDPVPDLREPAYLVVGLSHKGVPYGCQHGKPVHLFLLLCCKSIDLHLFFMGRLARFLSRANCVEQCLQCQDAEAMMRLMLTFEQEQFLN